MGYDRLVGIIGKGCDPFVDIGRSFFESFMDATSECCEVAATSRLTMIDGVIASYWLCTKCGQPCCLINEKEE
jgi:hypothetical protein